MEKHMSQLCVWGNVCVLPLFLEEFWLLKVSGGAGERTEQDERWLPFPRTTVHFPASTLQLTTTVTPVPEGPVHSSGLLGHCTHTHRTEIDADETHKIEINEINYPALGFTGPLSTPRPDEGCLPISASLPDGPGS